MKKHIEALTKRSEYLVGRLSNDHPAYGTILDGELLKETEALDWALGKLAEPEQEICPWTGEVLSGEEPVRTGNPIGTTGHYGPVHEGMRVQIKTATGGIVPGEYGKVVKFDRWIGEEYPYIVVTDDGKRAAFERNEIRRIDNAEPTTQGELNGQ